MTSRISTATDVRYTLFSAVLAVMLLISATSAHSDDKEEAKRLFDEGKAYFIGKQYEAAKADFRASVDLYPTRNSYYNLANCHKALRQYDKALAVIDEMKRRLTDAPSADMQAKFEALERSIRAIVGTLDLHVTPDGADILIDGDQVGTSPLTSPLPLAPGYHAVECRHDGFTPSQAQALVTPEETATLRVSLTPLLATVSIAVDVDSATISVDGIFSGKTPLKSPLMLAPGDHVIAVSKPGYEEQSREAFLTAAQSTTLEIKLAPLSVKAAPQSAPSVSAASDERIDRGRPKSLPVLFWTGLAGTVVNTAGFAVFLALAANREDSFNKNNQAFLTATGEENIAHYDKRRRSIRDQGISFNHAAMGLGIVAGVFAAGTIVVGVLGREGHKAEARKVSVAPGTLLVRF